jgi:hypothetical protein
MKYDLTELNHLQQIRFLSKAKDHLEDGYYRVFHNPNSGEFPLIRVDFVAK